MAFDLTGMKLAVSLGGAALALFSAQRAFAWQETAASPVVALSGGGHPLDRLAAAAAALVALAALMAASELDALGAAMFLCGLLYLALVDLRTLMVPVVPCAALVLAGVLFHAMRDGSDQGLAQVLGAAAMASAFLGLTFAYRRVRERDGLGEGDALIAGALGAWLPATSLGWSVALGGAATLAVVLFASRFAGRELNAPAPFAPGLAAGGMAALLMWGF